MRSVLISLVLLAPLSANGQEAAQPAPSPASPAPKGDLFDQVIANQKRMEATLELYERTQKVEFRKTGSDRNPANVKAWRVFPAGPAVNKIPLAAEGKPFSAESYRADLEKLEKYLVWVTQQGPAQQEAYAKAERKRKERNDLIVATREAFFFTRIGEEKRGDRTLLKYSMAPNPKYKPASRTAMLFTKVRGTVWIDEQSGELARIDGSVTEDISLGLFLAKVYKGSHFMQERYEMAPGVWFPTYEQYDFDGRKLFLSFSIHERTFYTNYMRVGPPKEALGVVRSELGKDANSP